jgi:hypothetical protein
VPQQWNVETDVVVAGFKAAGFAASVSPRSRSQGLGVELQEADYKIDWNKVMRR